MDSVSFGNTSWTDFTCYPPNDTISYLVEAVNPAGCISSKAVSHNSTRSNVQKNFSILDNVQLRTDNDMNLKIYPNPTNGKFTLVIASPNFFGTKQSQLSITNALGEIIYKAEINDEVSSIDLSNQPGGVYIVCIRAGAKVEHKKLVKE